MNTSEAKRSLKKAGFYIARVMAGHRIELWTNGTLEIRIGQSSTLAPADVSKVRAMLRAAIPEKKNYLTARQAVLHARVRALIDFHEVPRGSTGTIDELYATGFTVKWDLDKSLRDGFDARTELQFLERI